MNFFDLHCDTPYECFKRGIDFSADDLGVNSTFSPLFHKWSQVFAIWIREDVQNPFGFYKSVLEDFKIKLKRSNCNIKPYFSVEGGTVLERDIERLYLLKQDGISLLTLTWNGENEIAGGVDSQKGLTDFGKKAINLMNDIKMGCDLSHLNLKSFYYAVELAQFPLATHSCCFDVHKNNRNLNKEQIKLIAEKNGIIGLCLYPEFAGENVFEGIYKNIDYMCSMGYENNISIGSDFDGAKMHPEMNNTGKIPSLFEFMENKGLNTQLLNKIFYENAENYIENLL